MIVIEDINRCTFMDALRPQSPPPARNARQVLKLSETIAPTGRPAFITSTQQKRMQEMHAAGVTYADIGKHFGISHVHARRMVLNIVEVPHPQVHK